MTAQPQLEQWQLDAGGARAYERHLVPFFMQPAADGLLGLAELREGERVLDVACGTGIVARSAAARVGTAGAVTGVDLNEHMLAVAREAAAAVQPAITWRRADAADLPLPDAAFDVVFCQQALQFFSDGAAALREMRRVLAPGGRLALSVTRPLRYNPGYRALVEAVEQRVGREPGGMLRAIFNAPEPDALRALLAGAGFRSARLIILVLPLRFASAEQFVEVESAPLVEALAALSDERRRELYASLEAALGPYSDDDGLCFPFEGHLVLARP